MGVSGGTLCVGTSSSITLSLAGVREAHCHMHSRTFMGFPGLHLVYPTAHPASSDSSLPMSAAMSAAVAMQSRLSNETFNWLMAQSRASFSVHVTFAEPLDGYSQHRGKTIAITLKVTDTIDWLKTMVQAIVNIPKDAQKLTWRCRELKGYVNMYNNGIVHGYYQLSSNSVITCSTPPHTRHTCHRFRCPLGHSINFRAAAAAARKGGSGSSGSSGSSKRQQRQQKQRSSSGIEGKEKC